MADHDIQKSQHLLKRLEEEMHFLTSLMDQANGLLDQATFIASRLKGTWAEIDHVHKSWKQDTGGGKKKYFH